MKADQIINLAEKLNNTLESVKPIKGVDLTIRVDKQEVTLKDLKAIAKQENCTLWTPTVDLPFYWANIPLGKVHFELQTKNYKIEFKIIG